MHLVIRSHCETCPTQYQTRSVQHNTDTAIHASKYNYTENQYSPKMPRTGFVAVLPRRDEIRETEAEVGLLLGRHGIALRDQHPYQIEVHLAPAFVQLRLRVPHDITSHDTTSRHIISHLS